MTRIFQRLVQALVLSSASTFAATYYVNVNSQNPAPPFIGWVTAATNIQDAIDVAQAGDLVLVTNGTYSTGGRTNGTSYLTNRIVVDKALTVQSVNGPAVTAIEGYQVPGTVVGNSAIRCVYLTNGASLVGFTITNGATRGDGTQVTDAGAGVFCASSDCVVSNCVIVANSATGFGQAGGGVCSGTLFNCALVGNKAAGGAGAWNSALYNCTIVSNTATSQGGGVLGNAFAHLNGSVLENCIVEFNSAPNGGGISGLTVANNCVIRSNTATGGNGGGALAATLSNSTLYGNQAKGNSAGLGMGGGSYFSSLHSCTISNNIARRTGGGAEGGSLTNCAIVANTALFGGGVSRAVLWNSFVIGNAAEASGGGAYSNILINCLVSENFARQTGGGSYFSDMTNCLVAGNSATSVGGVLGGIARNSIIYYNSALSNPNYASNSINFCCTTPLPATGTGNIDDPPGLVDQFHVGESSQCIGAADSSSTLGLDLDQQPWLSPATIGCDEYYPGTATGPLNVDIIAESNDSTLGFASGVAGHFFARVTGSANSNYWDFGDGWSATNLTHATHAWSSPGLFTVKVWAFNLDNPDGIVAERVIQIVNQPVHHVHANNATPAAPYLTWETAATNIQDAVDAAFAGSSILVSNGVYRFGGKVAYGALSNRVAVTKPLPVRSVNGPRFTTIEGYQVPGTTNGDQAVRCVFLTNGASLNGFTLSNGATLNLGSAVGKSDQDFSGGGIWSASTNEIVTNCFVIGNSAYYWGAGAYSGTLNGCYLSNNINYNGSPFGGGGAAFSTLNGCVLSGNRANLGGGAHSAVLNSCILVSNSVSGARNSLLSNCTVSGNMGGGVDSCTLTSCIVSSNNSTAGFSAGGAMASMLRDCEISYNSGSSAGGLYNSTATNCVITGNKGSLAGGGAANAILYNCLISANTARDGSGVSGFSSRATNCVITGNWATNSGGGAASGAVLVNCLVAFNSATNTGGGASACTVINGTVVNNKAGQGGGVYQGTALNSILYFNSANSGMNVSLATVSYCNTTPFVPGAGHFTNAPRFVDQNARNFRLQTNSPCIGTGNTAYVSSTTDLDGRPRIIGGAVDVGAYEFQGAQMGEFLGWLQSFDLRSDGSLDFADSDADGMHNWNEWRADTIPTNALSVLRVLSATYDAAGVALVWQSVATRAYWIERSTNLDTAFYTINSNIPATSVTTVFTDSTSTNLPYSFYRVGVH